MSRGCERVCARGGARRAAGGGRGVVARLAPGHGRPRPHGEFTLFLCGLEDLKAAHQRVVHGHHGAGVVKLAALRGGREEGLRGGWRAAAAAAAATRIVHPARRRPPTHIIGRGEERDELALGKELVAVLDDLVRAAYEIQVVLVQELGHNLHAEGERHAAVVWCPYLHTNNHQPHPT